MRSYVLWTLPPLWLALGCARPARPAAMAEADTVRKAPAAVTAAALAPEAFAHAEKTRREAEDAYQSGDLSGAQILGERAVAAYQHALVLARIASATETSNRARAAIRAAEQSFAETDGEQKRVAAQADDLEVRIKVIKDAVPVAPAGPADATREQARFGSARSLALDAKLLCAAAKMVGSDTTVLAKAQSTLDELTKRLGEKSRAAPIEAAMRARAECLSALTAARRVASITSSTGRSDQLLAEVSAMGGLYPVRDDRGVVLTLRDLFAANQLTREAHERLTALGRVAQAHQDSDEDRRRGEAVAQSLVDAGANKDRVSVETAGTAHPVLEPARDPKRSERIEIIFVDPGG